jgi:two-component system, OmpR family, response regulator RegX3
VSERILVVDDEPAIVDAITYALRSEGFGVESRTDGESALEAALPAAFDLVILDLRLPGLSGIEVCRRLRAASEVPILILSARDAEVDRVLGLEAGADDYVTKPFSLAELVSRVRAIFRRRELDRGGAGFAVRTLGGLRIDLVRHRVTVDGEQVELTPTEFKLLAFLAHDPGRVFRRREVMQHLWESTYVGDERACDVHVSKLRKKIEADPDKPARLVTVRGVGYRLETV